MNNLYLKLVEIKNKVSAIYNETVEYIRKIKNPFVDIINEIWEVSVNPNDPYIPSQVSRIDKLEEKVSNLEKLEKESKLRFSVARRHVGTSFEELLIKNLDLGKNESSIAYHTNKYNMLFSKILSQSIPIPIKLQSPLTNYTLYTSSLNINIDLRKYYGDISGDLSSQPFSILRKSPFTPIITGNTLTNSLFDFSRNLEISNEPFSDNINQYINSQSFKIFVYVQVEPQPLLKYRVDTFFPNLFVFPVSKRWKRITILLNLVCKSTILSGTNPTDFILSNIIFKLRPYYCFLKIGQLGNSFEVITDLDPTFGAESDGIIPFYQEIQINFTTNTNFSKPIFIDTSLFNVDSIFKTDLIFPNAILMGIGFYSNYTITKNTNYTPPSDQIDLYQLYFESVNAIGWYNLTQFWAHEEGIEKQVFAP
ncbi:MAG: hypothetical protein QXR88_01650 [Candidatus Pacearchaeota archaeon]